MSASRGCRVADGDGGGEVEEREADALEEGDLVVGAAPRQAAAEHRAHLAEQMRRLEEMNREGRAELVGEVVRKVHLRGAEARFGRIGPDGRIGGW